MLSVDQARARAADLVAAARKAGADAADAIYVADGATQVQVRLGALEDVERSEGEDIGLRVFVGRRSASVSSSDLSPPALAALVERAVAMAREAPEDPHAGLAPEDRLLRAPPAELDLDDGVDPDPAALREAALEAEDAARAVAGVTNSEGAGASASRAAIAIATSHGFCGGYAMSGHGLSASVLAGSGGGMQRDYAHHSARHLADREAPASIGRRAGDRAVARLDPVRLASGPMPILFDPRVATSLIGHLLGAISGAAIARRTSFLLDSLGKAVFAPGVTISDDPHRIRGLRSRPFDGEGLPTAPMAIIDDGVLTGWLLDSASARQLALAPTGHATRGVGGPPGVGASNVHLHPGAQSRDALMADIRQGVLVTELIGQGVNGITGDYSRGASGFLIEDGKIGRAVAEITIAGNLADMFKALIPADDLEFRQAVNSPTVRIDGMTVAGG
ncbi:MAG: modulator protein [Sphingomonas sp. SCN 67-18]|uniref:TldD/PmbA family protein n=1 Tax=uncultured Sphingomonas sp. TaxID=158754 RepID=UPI00086CD722|nr:metallopeptidase TldD-related protein [Sphingomonas sp. SCN 67-18]ODU22127.1 MAG: modulator protein [Sphingomonas sp. SCN 67-18]